MLFKLIFIVVCALSQAFYYVEIIEKLGLKLLILVAAEVSEEDGNLDIDD